MSVIVCIQFESSHASWIRSTEDEYLVLARDTDRSGFCCRLHRHPPSCVAFAPRALPRFVALTDAVTPARRLFVPTRGAMNTDLPMQVSLLHATEPSDHSVSNHPLPSRCVVWVLRPSGLPAISTLGGIAPHRVMRHLGFAFARQARHGSRPNRVSHRTDWSFASSCSPPRLAATQLPSATRFQTNLGKDLHLA